MAPRRKSIGSLRVPLTDSLNKENNYLRSLSDFQARVRRRESIRNYKNVAEYDLEQKIKLETKIKEGSSRLLAAARHPAQSLEAARALFTSNKRMSAYMVELENRGKDASLKTSSSDSKGKLSISDLRFPLMWRDSDYFKNRGDYRRFAIFCIVRIGAEVQDTSLLFPIDRKQTDISFPDVLLFSNVSAEFELSLEVYSHILQEDLSIASTPRKIRRTIHSSISKTVGRKFAAALRNENESNKAPQFELLAYAKMTLNDTNENIRSHDLILNNFGSKANALPLFGHFCCRLAVQPYYIDKEVCAGFAIINNRRCWIRLRSFQIEVWKSKKCLEKLEKPTCTICVNKETIVRRSKSTKNQLRIINHLNGNEMRDVIELYSNEDVQEWFEKLETCIKEYVRWKHAAITVQQIPHSEYSNENINIMNTFNGRNKRHRSLYDETSLTDNICREENILCST
ncbi:rhotekin-like isoform X1 [Bombus huntii]|uniref:rhotekin-like isoform X1 n=1 Tax=Bombus huntii TaxID=85661 RepID=UPI0021A9F151|nr:rhotekin-like isoform X1 [Bombus huntii]